MKGTGDGANLLTQGWWSVTLTEKRRVGRNI